METTKKATSSKAKWMRRRGLVVLFTLLVMAGAVIGIAGVLQVSTTTSSANVANTSHFQFGLEADPAEHELYRQIDASSSANVVNTSRLPFGHGWAATYGTRSERAGIIALPFGPQIAANYGKPNDVPAAINALPFGPGWAATYGVPEH